MGSRVALYALALAAAITPLWMVQHLPMVDLPQHLYLISALERLHDPATLYPAFFSTGRWFTPYLGYYEAVRVLGFFVPLELSNKLFLSAYVASIPLSAAFLLSSLGRPCWPSLLGLPFAYGDSFGWGFVNSCSAWPFALMGAGACARALIEPRDRRWPVLLGLCLIGAFVFHPLGFAFLFLAVPLLLITFLVRRRHSGEVGLPGGCAVLMAIVPGSACFLTWAALRIGAASPIARGVPWKAWGPLLSAQNLAFKGLARNAVDLTAVLADVLRDGSDRLAVEASLGVALVACAARVLGLSRPSEARGGGLAPVLALTGLALLLFFGLPFDVRGYVYYLNTRFAQLVAILGVCLVPRIGPRLGRALFGVAVATALLLGTVLVRGFCAYDHEAGELDALVLATAPRPRVMGLIFDPYPRSVRLPVYLHAAAVLARERGGICNFSFASTPQSPVRYRSTPPPTFPSEWQPGAFRYEVEGGFYDHFLLRGAEPERVFGKRLGSELETVAHADGFWLVRRRPVP